MSLKKVKKGSNMYQWLSHCHAHLGGECSHKCVYCYVDNPIGGRNPKFTGPVRLLEEEFSINYGTGKTIFIEHMNDLFAEDVKDEDIKRIIAHCLIYPENTYVFQTKNPARMLKWVNFLPKKSILGTTIETNRTMHDISKAPQPYDRYVAMIHVPDGFKRFITIEPCLKFDVDILAKWISDIKPDHINIGSDSKGHNLIEPTMEDIELLILKLKSYGIEVKEKHNLQRLLKK